MAPSSAAARALSCAGRALESAAAAAANGRRAVHIAQLCRTGDHQDTRGTCVSGVAGTASPRPQRCHATPRSTRSASCLLVSGVGTGIVLMGRLLPAMYLPHAAYASIAGRRASASAASLRGLAARAGGGADGALAPPVAPRRPQAVLIGKVKGEDRGQFPMDPPREIEDDLFWLRDDERKNPEILEHLRAENAYTEVRTAHLQEERDSLYKEMLSHVKETDVGAQYRFGSFTYYTRTVEGLSYKIHARQRLGASGKEEEEVVVDENEVAKEFPKHLDVGTVQPSPTHELVGYSVDGLGFETYQVRFKQLSTGMMLDDVLENTTGEMVWGADDTVCFYGTFDETHRPDAVWRHVLGTPQSEDEKIFQDFDGLFNVGLSKTRDDRLLLVTSASTETSEVHALELINAEGRPTQQAPLRVVQEREFGLRYEVSHRSDWLYITTNEGGAKNGKVMVTPLRTPGKAHWRPIADKAGVVVLPHDVGRTISAATCFARHLVVMGREEGLTQVWILELATDEPAVVSWHRVQWPESAYECGFGMNFEMDLETTRGVQLTFSSPVTPKRTVLYEPGNHSFELVKQQEVPKYDPGLYASARKQVRARDGTLVPVTLFWRMDQVNVANTVDGEDAPSSPAPLHLYGYGSYGISIEPSFSSRALPLVDRGVVYAIAHIRGGSENGRSQWYEEGGKYLSKRNTFNDFVDVAEALVAQGWTKPDQMSCEGRSAGGLLVGSVVNQAPQLFRAALAGVPFVDLMVTMCDPSIPLTTGEWEEWGNPNNEKYFDYMLSYSPMDQVRSQEYPSILITSGLHDPRVAYWEPAKWAQRLREKRTNSKDDGKEVLLKMDLSSGHFSASDRYRYLRELAFDYAWLLDEVGLLPSTTGA